MVFAFRYQIVVVLLLACAGCAIPACARTVADIRAAGAVSCGGAARPGLAWPDGAGGWRGLEPDICRAVAVALLGPDAKAAFRSYGIPGDLRWPEQQADISFLTAAEMLGGPDLAERLPGPAVFTLAQSVAVAAASPARALADLGPALVCVEPGTATQRTLEDYLRAHDPAARLFMFQEDEERQDAFAGGRCDAIAGEAPGLAALAADNPGTMRLLPGAFAAEPVLATTPGDDPRWSAIVAWTVYSLTAGGPQGLRLDPGGIGLAPDWQARVAAAVGSYADILDRNLGERSDLHLPAGLNAPWNAGGAMVPPVSQ